MNWSENDHFIYILQRNCLCRQGVARGSLCRFLREASRASHRVPRGMSSRREIGVSGACRSAEPASLLSRGDGQRDCFLRSFLEVGVKPQAVSCRFKGGLNDHDLAFAERACRKLCVDHRILELDLLPFWENQGLEYADQLQCVVPSYPLHHVGDGSERGAFDHRDARCDSVKKGARGLSPWSRPLSRRTLGFEGARADFCLHRFCKKRGRPSCLSFFKYTPELMLAFLEERVVQDLVANRRPGKLLPTLRNGKFCLSTFFLSKEKSGMELRKFASKKWRWRTF